MFKSYLQSKSLIQYYNTVQHNITSAYYISKCMKLFILQLYSINSLHFILIPQNISLVGTMLYLARGRPYMRF